MKKFLSIALMALLALASTGYAQFEEPGGFPDGPGDLPGEPGDPGDPGDIPGMLTVGVSGPNGFSDMDMTLYWDLATDGNSAYFTSNVSGLTGYPEYQWDVDAFTVGTSSTLSLDLSSYAGMLIGVNLSVSDVDAYGSPISSGGAFFNIDIAQNLDPLSITAALNGVPGGPGVVVDLSVGEGLTCTSSGSGGDGNYSYEWDFNGGAADRFAQNLFVSDEEILDLMGFDSLDDFYAAAAQNGGFVEMFPSVTVSDSAGSAPVTGPMSVILVPEPATLSLLAIGIVGVIRRRK